MTVPTISPPAAYRFAVPPEPVLPLTIDQYHAMIHAGILESGSPIELLEGWLVTKMTKSPRHRAATRKTRIALERVTPKQWSVDVQEAITTGSSEPEPDVSIVRGDTADLLDRHPGPDEIGLLVEVADTSLDRDRGWKKRIYASAGIPVYWIVNLVDGCVEVYTQPERSDYAQRHAFQPGDSIPVILDGKEIGQVAADDLLP
jgi:Uma2 family endonuclease